MLFERVDRSEINRKVSEANERFGRIDQGLAAVDRAVARLKDAGIVPTGSEPSLPTESFGPDGDEQGERLAAGLLEDLGHVERLREEIGELEQTLVLRGHAIVDAGVARKAEIRAAIRNTLRVAAFMLLVVVLKNCVS